MNSATLAKACVGLIALGLVVCPNFARAGGVPEGHNAINADLGFSKGGADLGFDYEYGYDRTYSVGGYLRVIPDSTSNDALQNGVTTFGVFVRPHFSRANWDFYVSPGFGLISEKYVVNSSTYTMLGPSFAVGLLYELNPNMSVGAEEMAVYGWFNSTAGGLTNEDLTAKFRFIF